MATTIHNSANTAAAVIFTESELEQVGPFPSYVGSYENLREVSRHAAVDVMTCAGWANARATAVRLTNTGFEVTVRR